MEIIETAAGKRGEKLREANRAFEDRARTQVLESMRQEIKEHTGLDVMSDEFKESGMLDIMSSTFSIKKLAESVKRAKNTLREANVAGTLQQFLRAGIQLAVNNMYQKVETTFDGMYQSLPSNKAIELYAAAFRASFPELKGIGEEPRQAAIGAMDIQIANQTKAVRMLVLGEMAIEWDQTNQLQQQAQQIAENFPIFSDSIAVGRFASNDPAGSYAVLDANGDPVAASATGTQAGESTWPYNSTGFTNGGGKNAISSTAASYETIIQLRAMARQMKDPLGRKMLVSPDTLVCGVGLIDAFELMLKSELYPSTANIKAVSSTFTAGTDTTIGTQHALNILKGKFNLVSSIWLPSTAYYVSQAAKGFIKQVVKPVRVQIENPLSGPSFTIGAQRYKIDEMYTYEILEPRFTIRGSDGSA